MEVRQPERAHGQDGDYRAVRDLEGAAIGVPASRSTGRSICSRWSRSIVCEFGDHDGAGGSGGRDQRRRPSALIGAAAVDMDPIRCTSTVAVVGG